MDNKLGILLYGPPGTGKTGTISAIANMLKRDIILVNFVDINTCNDLDNIIDKNKDKIIVFDEFDYILNALNATNGKAQEKLEEKETKWAELLAVAEGDERKDIMKMIKENKQTKDRPLDIGYLLSKLDGLEDNNGRIIIATTNNPEKVNPVLLRPGRFDLKLCLNNCSHTMYEDIINSFFGVVPDISNIPAKKHSPLEVINTCIVYNDPKKVVAALEK
jgi:chaperone BCS1